MKRLLTSLLLFLASCNFLFAQQNLTTSRTSSYYTYIYKLSDKETFEIAAKSKAVIKDSFLHTLVDSFYTDNKKKYDKKLPFGNYLYVNAVKNKLNYHLVPVSNVVVQFINNRKDFQFLVTDLKGNLIPDALAKAGKGKAVNYDKEAKLYVARNGTHTKVITVIYNGISSYFTYDHDDERNNYIRPSLWYRISHIFHHKNKKSAYTGYMVFNKPRYKPLDTVKFKAYLVTTKGKAIYDKPLRVDLTDSYGNASNKTLATLDPYHAGGYEYSFVIADSLGLKLDQNYRVVLKERSGKIWKDAFSGYFQYEDYELKSVNFSVRTDKEEQRPGNPVSVFMKATDENELAIPDGRVEVVVITNAVSKFYDDQTFVKDSLWKTDIKLDPSGETKLILPDSIFSRADVSFSINFTFLNSNNERRTAYKALKYFFEDQHVRSTFIKDSLYLEYLVKGKSVKQQATVYTSFPNSDGEDSVQLQLPAKIKADYSANDYFIKMADGYKDYVFLEDLKPELSVAASQNKDSLHVAVNNVHKIPFWYTIFSGDKVFLRGHTNQLDTLIKHTSAKAAHVRINYIWGEEEFNQETSAFYSSESLNVKLLAPDMVYPGQTVNMQVKVTDAEDQPVAATDVTAYAYTAKFKAGNPVSLPYFGKNFFQRKQKPEIEGDDIGLIGDMKLTWDKWGKELGLDTIEYYKFTQNSQRYSIQEDGKDTTAVLAPFVVKEGEIVPVHIVYIDEVPVFFDQADQLKRYAFSVKPGLHNIRLRTSKYMVSLDNYDLVKGKKTIISVAADPLNTMAKVTVVPNSLTDYESSLLTKYMMRIQDEFGGRKSVINADNAVVLLNPPPTVKRDKDLLIGPLAENFMHFKSEGINHNFFKEPGYTYTFLPNLLKQKSYASKYGFNMHLPFSENYDDYKQYPLKSSEIDSIWDEYLDLRSYTTNLFNTSQQGNVYGKLTMKLDTVISNKMPYVKNVIIYNNNEPDFLQIYPGNTNYFSALEPGSYRVMYLFKDNRYLVAEHVGIKSNGVNYFKWTGIKINAADSLSNAIDRHIKSVNTVWPYYSRDNIEVKISENLNEKYFTPLDLKGEITGRVIDESSKSPIQGVSVRIKGLNYGVITRKDGRFEIKTPEKGKLVVSFIGYNTVQVNIKTGKIGDIVLKRLSNSLDEVTVVGYGTQKKSLMARAAVQVSSLLQGRVAGINIQGAKGKSVMIRGLNSLPTGQKPLVILDGLPFSGDVSSIDAGTIITMSVLKDKDATAIYGAKGVNGVIIIKTKDGNLHANIDGELVVQQQTIRTNFSDYSIWQPKLLTDEEGIASFKVKFPDDITNWTTRIIAMNGKRQAGITETSIKSFKTLSANFVSPLFALTGDSINVIGKLMNYSNATERVKRKLIYNGKELLNSDFDFKNAHLDTIAIVAQKNITDSLQFQYTMEQANGYFDGEIRKIPLYPLGVTETKGYFNALTTDTTVNYKFDADLGKVMLKAESSVFPTLLDEMEKLRNYEYFCNEQLASKLKGLLLEKTVREYLKEDFKGEKNIKDLIKKLQNNSRPEGTWGWWQNSNTEYWISLHVVEALLQAQKQGYAVSINKDRLHNSLVERLGDKNAIDQVQAIKLMRLLDEKYYIKDWLTAIDQQKYLNEKQSVYDKLQIMQLKQKAGLDVDVKWLLAQKKSTMFGNSYWGEENNRFWDNSIQNTLLAYQILKEKGGYKDELTRIQQYFLEQRKDCQWRNTYESSLILEAILPELMVAGKKFEPATITINNSETVTTFPFTKVIEPKALTINKKGNDPVYFTAYQQFNNPKPEKVSKDFVVKTWFEQNTQPVQKLKAGTATTLKVEVDVRADADYVMIEVPIPAGCSYENKMQSFWGVETHREYFKNKAVIFCTKLKQGKHSFSISLIPRYSGSYALNPAKAEMMYFPVFYGREGMKRVEVK